MRHAYCKFSFGHNAAKPVTRRLTRCLAAIIFAAALLSQPAQAKLSTRDGDAVMKRLDVDSVRQCGGGAAMMPMSGERIIQVCDAAIAAVATARSGEKSPNAGKTALYDLFEANMLLGKAFGLARRYGNPSDQTCAAFSQYAEVLGRVDPEALGPDFSEELGDEIEPATAALKACTKWSLAKRQYLSAGVSAGFAPVGRLGKALESCIDKYKDQIDLYPDQLRADCEEALTLIDRMLYEAPEMYGVVQAILPLKRAHIRAVEMLIEQQNKVTLDQESCRYAELTNASLIEVDPGRWDAELKSGTSELQGAIDRRLEKCRAEYRTPPVPFRMLHVN